MAHNYENEAVEKFLLPNQPDEGNFTSRAAYETTLKVYQHDRACVLDNHEQWKQHKQIEDPHQEAKAARVRAAAKKEHREAVEWTRKHPHIEEEEAEAGPSIECSKHCILKGTSDSMVSSSY